MPRLKSITAYWSTLSKNSRKARVMRGLMFSSLLLGVVLLTSQARGEIIDRITAIVNDDIITLSELERFRKSFYPNPPISDDWLNREIGLQDVRRRALEALIEEKLIDQEAERQNVNVTEKELEETIESMRREQGLTRGQLEKLLEEQDLTYATYTVEIEKGLKRTKLINRAVKSAIEVREKDVRDYYKTNIHQYRAEQSIRISHVLLPLALNPTIDREEETLSKAKEILMRVDQGEDFATVAHECAMNTPGAKQGDLGYFKRGDLIPSIEKSAFSLKVGEVGGPIRTPEGIVLIKLTEKKEGNPIPFDKIRKKTEADYYRSEVERQYRQWIDKLKKRSFIEVKL